jgi:hypothetical protein
MYSLVGCIVSVFCVEFHDASPGIRNPSPQRFRWTRRLWSTSTSACRLFEWNGRYVAIHLEIGVHGRPLPCGRGHLPLQVSRTVLARKIRHLVPIACHLALLCLSGSVCTLFGNRRISPNQERPTAVITTDVILATKYYRSFFVSVSG